MTTQMTPAKPRIRSNFSKLLPVVFVVGIVAGGWFVVQRLGTDDSSSEEVAADIAESFEPELVLSDAKVAKAGFKTTTAGMRKIADVRTVSGRLTYDEARHIEVTAPVSGVLTDVLVKPGDSVQEGQLLAVVNSPEIGRARAAVLNERAKYAVVRRHIERLQEVTDNLRILFALLDRNTPLDDIEKQFNDKSLGEYREEIMGTYSERYLANQLAAAGQTLSDSGSMSLRTVRERDNNRHVAEAKFRSARETTAYNIGIRMQQLQADESDAQRQVMIAQNHLSTLLGFTEEETETVDSESLSRMEVRAVFAGTIESRTYAKQERVQQGDSLFVLANTESLYVSADIRENEWAAMSVRSGQKLEVHAPAIPGRTFVANVHYVGREVEVASNSLPLVATISNADGLLRPGMFVRVAIPVGESDNVVAVPSAAVMQHENEQFVFVSVNEDTFRRVDVQTGVSNEQWVEISDGLKAGDQVVDGQAFLLKSELLLAGEE
jgi:cobalt-zinc-cadmium efflux system membrane fusion protein